MKSRLLFHLALGAMIFTCSTVYAQDTGGGVTGCGTGGGTGDTGGGTGGGTGGTGGGGNAIDYQSLGRAQAWFGQRGGGRWQDPVLPNGGTVGAPVLRPNNIVGGIPSFVFPGGLIAQPQNMNAIPAGGDNSSSQGMPSARDMKVMTAEERLNANAEQLASNSPIAKNALAKLSNAPTTARNYVVSMIARPENKKSGEEAMAAAQLLVALPTSDVARLVTHPTSDVSNMQLADFYTEKLQNLAGVDPLAFSGRKLVVITTQGDSSAELLRAGASRSMDVPGLTPAEALEQIITGQTENPAIVGMKNTAIQVLAQKDSSIWLHATADSVSTLPHLKAFSNSQQSAVNPSEELLARATIVYSGDSGVQAIQVPAASRAGLSLTLADLQQTSIEQPTLSDIERIAETVHPQLLVAAVKNSTDASSAVTKLKANPWYGTNAAYLVLLQHDKGTELLLF